MPLLRCVSAMIRRDVIYSLLLLNCMDCERPSAGWLAPSPCPLFSAQGPVVAALCGAAVDSRDRDKACPRRADAGCGQRL
jgi:hypothetical protein